MTQSLDQPPNATRSSLNSLGGYPPLPVPTATTFLTARDPIVTSHSLSRPGGYNSAPTAAKRRHTDPPNNCDNGTAQKQHHQPLPHQQPRPATSKRHRTRSHTRTEQTKGNLDDAVSSSTEYPEAIPLPQHLLPQERELARLQLHNHILMWQRKHGHQDQHPNPTVDRQPSDAAPANHTSYAQLRIAQAQRMCLKPTQRRPQPALRSSSNRVHRALPPLPMTTPPLPTSRTPPQQIQPTA